MDSNILDHLVAYIESLPDTYTRAELINNFVSKYNGIEFSDMVQELRLESIIDSINAELNIRNASRANLKNQLSEICVSLLSAPSIPRKKRRLPI